MFFVFLLYALFASVFTIAKNGLQYAQPFFFVGSRMLLAGVLMLAYQYFFQRKHFTFSMKHAWRFFLLALFNIYITNVSEFWGLQYLTSFKTCFIYSLSPFVSALLSYFIFSETMTNKKWLGLLVGFAGFLPILLSQTSVEQAAGQLLIFSWPEVSVMIAAVCGVYGWILLRQVVKENGYSPLMANGVSMALGGAMALLNSYVIEDWDPLPITEYVPFIECAVLLIIISNLIAYNLYGFLLKKYSATFMSFAGCTTPLFTALFGWIFLGETATWAFFASSLIVFSGLLLFYQQELRYGYYAQAEPIKVQS